MAVADPARARPGIPAALLTGDAKAPGRRRPRGRGGRADRRHSTRRRSLVEAALAAGKPVVTANKELLAAHGAELARAAAAAGVDLLYEAAVAGAIPIIRPLRESLAGERIRRVMGIVNGTTNFILSTMSETGALLRRGPGRGPALGLRRARPDGRRGGPRRRRQGGHPGQPRLPPRRGRRRRASRGDRLGPAGRHRLRRARSGTWSSCWPSPSGSTRRSRSGRATPRSRSGSTRRCSRRPTRWPPCGAPSTPCSSRATPAGELMLYGRGCGRAADGVRRPRRPDRRRPPPALGGGRPARSRGPGRGSGPTDDLRCAWYLSIDVLDRPGVLAAVARVFGDHGVSIRSMEQVGLGDEARLIFLTHVAREGDVAAHHRRAARARRRRAGRRGAARRGRRGGRLSDVRLARGHRGVPGPPPGHRRPRRWSRCSRATRRCSRRRGCPSASAAGCCSSSRASTPPGRSRTAG